VPPGLHVLLLRLFGRLPVRARRRVVRLLTPSFTVGANCVIERDDGAILLVRQVYRKRWGLPGGLLERGEEPATAVVRENAGRAELLIIKRAERERDHWSGHLALPGGRREASDADLVRTAVRETWEEVGLDLDDGGAVLGGLDVVRPQSPLAPQVEVWPFVAAAPPAYHVPEGGPAPRELVLNHEVAAAFWLPAALLRERGRSEVFRMVFGGRQLKWPAYASEHGPIWGITERILTNFLALAWGQET